MPGKTNSNRPTWRRDRPVPGRLARRRRRKLPEASPCQAELAAFPDTQAFESSLHTNGGPVGRAGPSGKLGLLVGLLRRPAGVDIKEMAAATSWQAHTVRGALSGALRKRWGYALVSEGTDVGRIYKIVEEQQL